MTDQTALPDTQPEAPATEQAIPPVIVPNHIKEVAKKLTIKELLDSLGKPGSTKILRERTVSFSLDGGESILELTVHELTKNQYDKLLEYTTARMPEVPMIEQRYTQARRNPLTGEIKPAGSYMEANPEDPSYTQATQRWFNDSAVLFGLFAAADDFDFDLGKSGDELATHVTEQIERVTTAFSTPTLLDIAYEASHVNRGIPMAEQLISVVEAHRSMMVDTDDSELLA